MSTTEASLQILKCALCDKSLSVFPISTIINLASKTSKNICGRCPTNAEEDDVITQNTIYEALAEQILFPCQYKPNGCGERITPLKLSKHEMFCAQKPIFCPHTPLRSCVWKGCKRELLGHFQLKHRFLVIENCITEIDIVTKQQENYLMQFNHDLYIVQFVCDEDDDALQVNIRIIGSENSINRFQYYLSFYHNVGESSDTETNNVELFDMDNPQDSPIISKSTCVVQISNLKMALNDPSTIRCRIVITPSQIVSFMDSSIEAEEAATAGEDNNNLDDFTGAISSTHMYNAKINEDLRRKLECPVCLAHFKVPVLQCVQGHSLCGTCRPTSNTCPECRSQFAITRNFTLEKILEVTPFSCKNGYFGCKYMGVPAELGKHEPTCAYCRTCPLTDIKNYNRGHCPWRGNIFDILQHCRSVHSDDVLDLDFVTYYLPNHGEEEYQTYLLHRYEQLFTLHFFCDQLGNCYWRVQWVDVSLNEGTTKANYAYEVCVVAGNSCKISVQKPIDTKFLSTEQLFELTEECGYIMIPCCQLQRFIIMDITLEYLIHVYPL